MKILFIDDDKQRRRDFSRNSVGHDVDYATSYDEAIECLREGKYDCICFDHDLEEASYRGEHGPHIKTGLDIARFVVERPDPLPRLLLIHSLNEGGANAIQMRLMSDTEKLSDGNYWVRKATFLWAKNFNDYLVSIGYGPRITT
jgi:CheY-like chemotaxis protein